MKRLFGVLAMSLCTIGAWAGDEVKTMLVGTYTEGGTSEGAYVVNFNQEDGSAEVVSSTRVGNPSFVIPSADGKKAFCVNEFNDGRQAATSFNFDGQRLSPISALSTQSEAKEGGKDPCNIATDGNVLVTSNYSSGDLSVMRLDPDGSISSLVQYIAFEPQSHIHCLTYSPDGRYAFVIDLGADCVYRFDVCREHPEHYLEGKTIAYQAEKGFGPRHFVFDAAGRHAYLICELSDKLVSFGYADGTLTPLQTLDAYDGKGGGSADIHISPDGRFLYTSHRLKEDGVSIFSIDAQTGRVSKVGFQPTGIHPRNFGISPNGKYLLVACRDSNVIQVFERDQQTGQLANTGKDIRLSKPVSVMFVP